MPEKKIINKKKNLTSRAFHAHDTWSSVLLLSGGIESEWKRYNSSLTVEKCQRFSMNPTLQNFSKNIETTSAVTAMRPTLLVRGIVVV